MFHDSIAGRRKATPVGYLLGRGHRPQTNSLWLISSSNIITCFVFFERKELVKLGSQSA